MKKSWSLIWVIFGLTALVSFHGCSSDAGKAKITLATSKNIWCAATLIASEKGYFAEQRIDVHDEYLAAGRYCMDALLSNSAQVGTVVDVNFANLGYTDVQSVRLVATIVTSVDSAIIAAPKSGIAKAEDLKGKKLAVSPGTTSEIFAYRFLQKHGLRSDDVELRKIQPPALQGAMISGEVDAVSTWDPFLHNIEKALGKNTVVFRDPEVYTGTMNVAVRRDWAEKNPETVKKFLRALRKAEKFAADHPAEAKELLAKKTNLDRDVVDAIWPNYSISLTFDSKTLLATITHEGELFGRINEAFAAKKLPDYQVFLDPSYFKHVQGE